MGQGFIAREPFLNPTAPKPEFSRSLAGLSFGGPLIRDQLHVFASYEGNYQNRFANVGLRNGSRAMKPCPMP